MTSPNRNHVINTRFESSNQHRLFVKRIIQLASFVCEKLNDVWVFIIQVSRERNIERQQIKQTRWSVKPTDYCFQSPSQINDKNQ